MAICLASSVIRRACIAIYITTEIVLVTLFFMAIKSDTPVILALCITHACSIAIAIWTAVSVFNDGLATDDTDRTVHTLTFILASLSLTTYGFYLTRTPAYTVFPTPHSLAKAEAAFAVLGLSIGNWCMMLYLFVTFWMPSRYIQAEKPKKPHSIFTTFNKSNKAGVKKPLPVRILNIVHNSDPSIYEKHPRPANQQRPWTILPEIEAGGPMYPEKMFDGSDWVDLPLH